MTKEEVRERLGVYRQTDNRVTELSRAYRIQLGTGWYTPPDVATPRGPISPSSRSGTATSTTSTRRRHPQGLSIRVPRRKVPEEKKEDFDYVMSLMDGKERRPAYRKTYFRPPWSPPKGTGDVEEVGRPNNTGWIAGKEPTVYPGAR